ncbi:MAG: hypothetical protein V2B19_09250 [Pseudomonadota bacterium]
MNRIPPNLLFTEKENGRMLLMDVSDSGNAKNRSVFPEAVTIPFNMPAPQFADKVRTVLQDHGAAARPVLVFTGGGEDYGRIEKVMQSIGMDDFFYLVKESWDMKTIYWIRKE